MEWKKTGVFKMTQAKYFQKLKCNQLVFFPNGKFGSERVDLLKDAGFKTITISIESFDE